MAIKSEEEITTYSMKANFLHITVFLLLNRKKKHLQKRISSQIKIKIDIDPSGFGLVEIEQARPHMLGECDRDPQ